jgi:hypothetical protein
LERDKTSLPQHARIVNKDPEEMPVADSLGQSVLDALTDVDAKTSSRRSKLKA